MAVGYLPILLATWPLWLWACLHWALIRVCFACRLTWAHPELSLTCQRVFIVTRINSMVHDMQDWVISLDSWDSRGLQRAIWFSNKLSMCHGSSMSGDCNEMLTLPVLGFTLISRFIVRSWSNPSATCGNMKLRLQVDMKIVLSAHTRLTCKVSVRTAMMQY